MTVGMSMAVTKKSLEISSFYRTKPSVLPSIINTWFRFSFTLLQPTYHNYGVKAYSIFTFDSVLFCRAHDRLIHSAVSILSPVIIHTLMPPALRLSMVDFKLIVSLLVLLRPLRKKFLRQFFACNHQGPQSSHWQILALLLNEPLLLLACDKILHYCICSLQVKDNLSINRIYKNYTHSLGLALKWKWILDFILHHAPIRHFYLHCTLRSLLDRQTKTFGHFNKSNFVGTGSLIILFSAIFVEDGGDVVAEHEGSHNALQALFLRVDPLRNLIVVLHRVDDLLGLFVRKFNLIIDWYLLEQHLILR